MEKEYKKIVKRLGYIVLLSSKGHSEEVRKYCMHIWTVVIEFDKKIKITREGDKRDDLIIMKDELEYIYNFVNAKILPTG